VIAAIRKRRETLMGRDQKREKPKLYPNSHWDRPPSKPMGDREALSIYTAVGQALTNWETLESRFAELFSILVEGGTSAAKRVYGAITTSHGRRVALQAAAEIFFIDHHIPESEQDIFNDLISHFGKAASRRDEIAHGMAYGFAINGVSKGAFLFPPAYNTERTHPYPPRPPGKDETDPMWTEEFRYTAADIMEIARKFHEMMPHVYQCGVRLHRLAHPQNYLQNPASPPESPPQ
jgi:hypothetical protein